MRLNALIAGFAAVGTLAHADPGALGRETTDISGLQNRASLRLAHVVPDSHMPPARPVNSRTLLKRDHDHEDDDGDDSDSDGDDDHDDHNDDHNHSQSRKGASKIIGGVVGGVVGGIVVLLTVLILLYVFHFRPEKKERRMKDRKTKRRWWERKREDEKKWPNDNHEDEENAFPAGHPPGQARQSAVTAGANEPPHYGLAVKKMPSSAVPMGPVHARAPILPPIPPAGTMASPAELQSPIDGRPPASLPPALQPYDQKDDRIVVRPLNLRRNPL
ncbi:hypothetical protein GGR50DRAFT_166238 [Xylaria sp. CBS 124048]|nr:hypothetical protein GGR50DRAFT_166238 [Xylaria sp. CBS 124048]